jgi:hypothetical protein
MKIDLVLSRFNEDTAWTKFIRGDCRLIVYNKGDGAERPLPNVGREAQTYLYYMTVNHGVFPDWVFFAQANPFAHCHDFVDILNNWPYSFKKSSLYAQQGLNFFASEPVRFIEVNPPGDDAANDCEGMWSELFQESIPGTKAFSPAGIFAISSKLLMTRSSAFYQKAMELAVSRPRGPWEFERLWAYLWTSSAVTKL